MTLRHSLVRELIAHFADAAGVRRRIRVFTSAALYERYSKRRGGLSSDEREHLLKGYAIARYRERTPHEIYVNTPRHVSPQELLDTAAHEVVHVRWPTLAHGATFDRRKSALLAGYRCGPKSSRLPEAFR